MAVKILIMAAALTMLVACKGRDAEARQACHDEAVTSAKQNDVTENCMRTLNCGVEVRELNRYYKSKEILKACDEKYGQERK